MLLDGAGRLLELRLQAGNAGGGGAGGGAVGVESCWAAAVTTAVGGSAGLRLCALDWSKGLCESETRGVRK